MPRLAVVLGLIVVVPAGAEVHSSRFASKALGREISALVQLPPSYAASPGRRYPYVIVLHGLFESPGFWERRKLAPLLEQGWAEGRLPEFVLVAVDGGNSFYVNSPGGRFEDVVLEDAPAWIESTLRVHKGRAARGLWGVSMGGYASLRVALSHPEAFAAVAAHSAMLLERIPSLEQGAGRWHMQAFSQVFGDPIDETLWSANDPLRLALRAEPKGAPALFFDCGAQDRYGLARGNQALHRALAARGIQHAFALPPGDHGYEYVLSVVENSLRFLGSALTPRSSR